MKLSVVKIGGNVIDDPTQLDHFLTDFSALEDHKILVHGGGKVATRLADELGIETQMVNGRRITNDDSIDIAVMTYGGLINKKVVANLHAKGSEAIGLTGADGNLIQSNKRPLVSGIDFGWVGDPQFVNAKFLHQLIQSGLVPVIAPLTHDGKGNMLNTNADTIASCIATAMSTDYQVELNYCFEMPGVLANPEDPTSVVPIIDQNQYKALAESGSISQGMIPKMDNAFDALAQGVATVRIMNYSELESINNSSYAGTIIK